MAYRPKVRPLGPACREALRDGVLRRCAGESIWHGAPKRTYHNAIGFRLQDRGLMRPDLEADPAGRVLVRTEAGDEEAAKL